MNLKDFLNIPESERTDEFSIDMVSKYPHSLSLINNQTNEMCLTAVKQDGCSLFLVKNQNSEICLAAVKQNSSAINFVRHMSDEIVKEFFQDVNFKESDFNQLISYHPYIKDKIGNPNKLLIAIKNQYQKDKQCLKKIRENPTFFLKELENSLNKNETINTIGKTKMTIKNITKQEFINIPEHQRTEDDCIALISNDIKNLVYVQHQTKKVIEFAFEKSSDAIFYLNRLNDEILLEALKTFDFKKTNFDDFMRDRMFKFVRPVKDDNVLLVRLNKAYADPDFRQEFMSNAYAKALELLSNDVNKDAALINKDPMNAYNIKNFDRFSAEAFIKTLSIDNPIFEKLYDAYISEKYYVIPVLLNAHKNSIINRQASAIYSDLIIYRDLKLMGDTQPIDKIKNEKNTIENSIKECWFKEDTIKFMLDKKMITLELIPDEFSSSILLSQPQRETIFVTDDNYSSLLDKIKKSRIGSNQEQESKGDCKY